MIRSVSLPDILQWLTGASHYPAIGFPTGVTVNFDMDASLPKINTCALQMRLPIGRNLLDPVKAMETILGWIIDSPSFGQV